MADMVIERTSPYTAPQELNARKKEALDALVAHLKKAEEEADREGWISADDAERMLGVHN